MKSDREIEKMVSRLGLKRTEKQAVVQYSKGMRDGMHMAYVAVARNLLARGQDERMVRELLGPLVKKHEMADLLAEAKEPPAD